MVAQTVSTTGGGRETSIMSKRERERRGVGGVVGLVSEVGLVLVLYLGSFLPRQKQICSTLVLVPSRSGSIPEELDLDLTN